VHIGAQRHVNCSD